jgi:hypothetical protein
MCPFLQFLVLYVVLVHVILVLSLSLDFYYLYNGGISCFLVIDSVLLEYRCYDRKWKKEFVVKRTDYCIWVHVVKISKKNWLLYLSTNLGLLEWYIVVEEDKMGKQNPWWLMMQQLKSDDRKTEIICSPTVVKKRVVFCLIEKNCEWLKNLIPRVIHDHHSLLIHVTTVKMKSLKFHFQTRYRHIHLYGWM